MQNRGWCPEVLGHLGSRGRLLKFLDEIQELANRVHDLIRSPQGSFVIRFVELPRLHLATFIPTLALMPQKYSKGNSELCIRIASANQKFLLPCLPRLFILEDPPCPYATEPFGESEDNHRTPTEGYEN